MSELVLRSEILNAVLDGKEISCEMAMQLYETAKDDSEILKTAQALRLRAHKNTVTFSKKAFFNLINLCRDTCTYCTYKSEPSSKTLSMMDKKNVQDLLRLAKKYHCTEALFVTGERPEAKYPEAKSWLEKNGFASTAEYIIHCSEMALEEGLYPHTNAGNLTMHEMREISKTNPSMGLMLENASPRLSEKSMPHQLAPSKDPKERIKILENSGRLGIPMTTGLLIGIGEVPSEIIESLFVIRDLHKRFGNIQEVILQNFQPKPDTAMRDKPSANEKYFKSMVALARIIMPKMNIQIPPNLSPKSYQDFLLAGINDWGGISPLTPDYVNPEFEWPTINDVKENSSNAGFELQCRFPVYPEFIPHLDSDLKSKVLELADENGLVKEEYWK